MTGAYSQTGVIIENRAFANTIGGANAGEGNVISGNKGDGVTINGFGSDDNQILGNIIGLSESRLTAFPNTGNGITISANDPPEQAGPNGNIIGGSGNAANTISANGGNGIAIVSGLITRVGAVTIAGNLIGLKKNPVGGSLNSPAGNTADNIWIDRATSAMIGGSGAGNTIVSSVNGSGIRLSDVVSSTITSNQIGTLVSGNSASNLGNKLNGILLDTKSTSSTITLNEIRYNQANGVSVQGGSQPVTILDNKISRNALKGIELDTTTDTFWPGGSEAKSNHDIDPPFSLRVNQAGQLTGRVRDDSTNSATRASSCFGCTIQVFRADPNVKDGQGRDKLLDITVSAGGYFTATLAGLPTEGQLALTATDDSGNTSEFATFNPSLGVAFTAPGYGQNAYPGDVVTYTHRITNTGSVDLTLKLTAQLGPSSLGKWTATPLPSGDINLPAHQSAPVTLTLKLPTGSDQSVIAGTIEKTRLTITSTRYPTVTDTLTDTTTVLGKFILSVTPTAQSGITTQNTSIDYPHTLTNIGNLAGTVAITASTEPAWKTTIVPLTASLAPGQSIGATAHVVLPQQVTAGTVGKTTVRITASDPSQNKILTDTTTVSLTSLATMVPNQERDAAAGETISIQHTVTNRSNGTATFKLFGSSSLGSKIKFRSNTAGVTLGSDNSFTIGNTSGNDTFNFFVDITVDPKAFRGDTDLVTIGLTDPQGIIIGGASVQDTIHVTRSAIVPRLYLPIIRR